MSTVNPYLNFHGNTEEAFNFYKSVFGGEFMAVMRYKDMPEADKIPAAELDKIIHISLPIGKNSILMATDTLDSMGQKLIPGNNFSLSVSPDSKNDAEKIFSKLSEGGKVIMPMENAFWGAYFGMLTDKFGIQWMINFDGKPAE